MERQVSVYALCDPDTGDVRYIGQTIDTKRRLYEHINKIHVGNKKKQDWIQSLLNQAKVPLLKIICVVDQSIANQIEMDAITQTKLDGANLLNGTPRAFGGGQTGWAHGKQVKSTFRIELRRVPVEQSGKQTEVGFKSTTEQLIEALANRLGISYTALPQAAQREDQDHDDRQGWQPDGTSHRLLSK